MAGYQSKITYYNETVVPARGEPSLLVLDWEGATARLHSWLPRIETFDELQRFARKLANHLKDRDLFTGCIGVETKSWAVTAHLFDTMRSSLQEAELVDASGIVEAVKVVKSPAELEYIREAARITDLGVAAAIDTRGAGENQQRCRRGSLRGNDRGRKRIHVRRGLRSVRPPVGDHPMRHTNGSRSSPENPSCWRWALSTSGTSPHSSGPFRSVLLPKMSSDCRKHRSPRSMKCCHACDLVRTHRKLPTPLGRDLPKPGPMRGRTAALLMLWDSPSHRVGSRAITL